jgi:hypothetical protein
MVWKIEAGHPETTHFFGLWFLEINNLSIKYGGMEPVHTNANYTFVPVYRHEVRSAYCIASMDGIQVQLRDETLRTAHYYLLQKHNME